MAGKHDSKAKKGFTLVELLIYSGIFAMVAITLLYFLTVFIRVTGYQASSTEVARQGNFILQKIEYEVANASTVTVNDSGNDEVDDALNTPRTQLVIKDRGETTATASDPQSPIIMYQQGTNALLKRGNQQPEVLNSPKVQVTNLRFTKVSTPQSRDVVLIDLTLRYQHPDPQQQVTRQFTLGIGKASAATFDTTLNPGGSSLDIGTSGGKWKTLFLSQDINIDGKIFWNGSSAGTSNSIGFLRQGTISIDPPSLGADTSGNAPAVTITGAQTGDRVFMTPPITLEDGLVFVGATAGTNTITVRVRNTSSALVNGGLQSWSYLILR